jgi:peptidoglycan-N-acetylmuramic acid deacetylase
VQPSVAQELSFVEELDAIFLDRSHSDTTEEKVVYLTFDAGYENGNVERILDVLKDREVFAAFFILANLVKRNPELVKRMAEEGHTVCNHTASHKDMSGADDATLLAELQSMETLYKETTGRELAHYYRPPEGRFSRRNLECLSKNGYKTVFWSFAYPDWNNERQMSVEKAKSIILDNVHNGEIMLLHPTSETNAAVLGEVIDALRRDGYRFGTLEECIPLER